MQASLTARALSEAYQALRALTRTLCEPLGIEDQLVQSMPDVSPTKWHLAHTSWFFETFVLVPRLAGHAPSPPAYAVLFNSYYNSVGAQFPRPRRGLISRPTLEEVWHYRRRVDDAMLELLATDIDVATAQAVELGLHHEQQHQELILTDIKHVLAQNPLYPAYRPEAAAHEPAGGAADAPPEGMRRYDGGLVEIGHTGDGFSFDNERPRHRVFVPPFALASRLVTAGEYLGFIEDGGYRRPELWLSEGWDWREREGVEAPLYWSRIDEVWNVFTLAGMKPLDPAEPVAHVSLYEADAYARWAGARLPRESELELALRDEPLAGNFVDSGRLHPAPATGSQLWGDTWEWTQSQYLPYPGYVPAPGAFGEYNGKFMCNQHVLRGGSCFTSRAHMRPSYRNFFPARARWQMTGIRLAKEAA